MLETVIPEGPAPSGRSATRFRRPTVTPSASFLATTRMAINAGRTQGMQVGNGADMVLRHQAEAEGKIVEGLETLQSQLDMFNQMPATPAAAPPRAWHAALADSQMDSLSKAMAEMQSAWKRGDQSVFVRLLDQLNGAAPDTYRMMFTERNERWADWITGADANPGNRVRRGRRRPSRGQGQPARAPCRARHPIAPRKLDAAKLAFLRRRPLGRALPAMVIPGGVARGI